ncbi:MAG: hypothetical protein COV99_01270 [Bacteroidetes bacterium CG12_big_fil_rev_8_21_14_0_65_60_17]|nr:MAG: hypothetical protein COV99_01270 [Bacteroidetes bacterium CG12_big_fil_rev_8_21_14_0_65_60_17]
MPRLATILVSGLVWMAWGLLTPVVSAQHADHGHSASDHVHGHFCATDSGSDEARRHMAAYLNARQAGLLPRRKSASPPDVGDEEEFNVLESGAWTPLEFRVVDITGSYVLWVEIAELNNGNVTPGEIAGFRDVIFEGTPAQSIDPSKGIFENIHDVFGLPPDVDGDGLVDILLYDIGRGPTGTLGYVSSTDVNPNAGPGQGNGRDVLYLDSASGTSNLTTLAAIAAHEYTHLVHLSSGWDEAFLTEGYAEYAMIMLGYFWRSINYFSLPDEYRRTLFEWRDGGGPGAMDYQRAGLFITYLANRVGSMGVAQMLTGETLKGAKGIDSVLVMHGDDLGSAITDFHTANLYNDRSFDDRFGYIEGGRSSIRIDLTGREINGETPSRTGEGGFQTRLTNHAINAGAVRYVRWTDVSDFQFVFDMPSWRFFPPAFQEQQRETLRGRNRVRLVLEPDDGGPLQVTELLGSEESTHFEGNFSTVTAVFTHTNPEAVPGDNLEISASWTPRSVATPVETLAEQPDPDAPALSVWPNPVSDQLSVSISAGRSGFYRVDMYDILGRRVNNLFQGILPGGTTHIRSATGMLSPGSYVIHLDGGGLQATRLIQVVR